MICTGCDHRAEMSDVQEHCYRFDNELYPLRTTHGWCRACATFRHIERRPTQTHIDDLDAMIAAVDQVIAAEQDADPARRLVIRQKHGETFLMKAYELSPSDREWASYRDRLLREREWLIRLAALALWNQCLKCRSQDVVLVDESLDYTGRTSLSGWTGFKHPGCGGYFVKVTDQIAHYNVSVRTRSLYDLNGDFVAHERVTMRPTTLATSPVESTNIKPSGNALKNLWAWLKG